MNVTIYTYCSKFSEPHVASKAVTIIFLVTDTVCPKTVLFIYVFS